MFSSSLRKRSLWRSFGPLATSSTTPTLKESSDCSVDLALPFTAKTGRGLIFVLLLEVTDLDTNAAFERIRKFSDTHKNRQCLILLVQGSDENPTTRFDAMNAYMSLQLGVFGIAQIPPSLLVPSAAAILTYVEKFIMELDKVQPPRFTETFLPTNLIAQTTSTAPAQPLSEHVSNVISDLFPSIRALEEATRTEEGQAKLYEYLDQGIVESMIEFWEDDYVI